MSVLYRMPMTLSRQHAIPSATWYTAAADYQSGHITIQNLCS